MRASVFIALSLFAFPALGQGWRHGVDPSGGWAGASVASGPLTAVALECVAPAFDLAAYARAAGDNHGPMISGPGVWKFSIGGQALPRAAARADMDTGEAERIRLEVDGRPVPAPDWRWNMIDSTFSFEAPFGHPIEEALSRGSRLSFAHETSGERGGAALSGSSRAIEAAKAICVERSAPSSADGELDAALARAHPDAARVIALRGEGEALVFVLTPFPGGNAMRQQVFLYDDANGWRARGEVEGVLGVEPRDIRFLPDRVEFVTTTLRPGEPRCCPTGRSSWSIDRRSLRASAR